MANTTYLSITPPAPFDFANTSSSHGWVVLAPNSWYTKRGLVTCKYFHGQLVSDKEAQAVYQDWGRWKYLAYWFDIYEEHS